MRSGRVDYQDDDYDDDEFVDCSVYGQREHSRSMRIVAQTK